MQHFSMPWDLGPRKAKEYLFTAEYLTAAKAETMALAQKIATNDPFAMKMAKLSVNETMDAQGQREALERSFKNYMLTIPHRQEQGTYGAAARAKSPKERFAVLNAKRGEGGK